MAAVVLAAGMLMWPGPLVFGQGQNPARASQTESQPADRRDRLVLCRHLLEKGKNDEAYAVADSVVEIPREDRGLYLTAEVLLQLGESTEARRACLAGLASRESPFGRCLLGRIHIAEGLYALAIEQFERAASLGYSDPRLHYGFAQGYAGLGNYLGELQRVQIDPDETLSAGAFVDEGVVVERVRDTPGEYSAAPPASAIYQVKMAQRLGLESVEAQLLEASIWRRANHASRAVEIYRELATRIDESDLSGAEKGRFYEDYAAALFGADDLAASVEAIKRCARLDPNRCGPKLVEAYDQAASRCVQRGDLNGYIHYLELALAEAPDSVDFHYRLGFAYWEAGRKNDAAREWQITLQLDPQHLDRERLLELIQDVVSGR